MKTFELSELLGEHRRMQRAYFEFLRVPALSTGLYFLPAGGVDGQRPHNEDELYHVLSGRGLMRLGQEDRPVGPGTLIFVPAHVEHRFHSITEDLTLLVVFAPAES